MRPAKIIEYTEDLYMGQDAKLLFDALTHNWQRQSDVRRKIGLGLDRFQLAIMDIQRCKLQVQIEANKIRLQLHQPAVKHCECSVCKAKNKPLPIYEFPHGVVVSHYVLDNKRHEQRKATFSRVKYCIDCCRGEDARTKHLSLHG